MYTFSVLFKDTPASAFVNKFYYAYNYMKAFPLFFSIHHFKKTDQYKHVLYTFVKTISAAFDNSFG